MVRIKIGGIDTSPEKPPLDLNTCTIDIWFTRGGPRWTACLIDVDGNQVSEAQFAYHKADFKNIKKTDFIIQQHLQS